MVIVEDLVIRHLPQILATKNKSTQKIKIEDACIHISTVRRGFQDMDMSHTMKLMNSLRESKYAATLPYETHSSLTKYLNSSAAEVWVFFKLKFYDRFINQRLVSSQGTIWRIKVSCPFEGE